MRYFINADTLFSLVTTGTVCRYTATGWVPAAEMTPQALAGPGCWPIAASEAVRIQRDPMGVDYAGAQDLLPQVLTEQTVVSYTNGVPVSLLREGLLTGTPEEVIEQVAEWRDHGLRYAVVGNVSSLQPRLRRGLAATLPFAKIIRGLRRL